MSSPGTPQPGGPDATNGPGSAGPGANGTGPQPPTGSTAAAQPPTGSGPGAEPPKKKTWPYVLIGGGCCLLLVIALVVAGAVGFSVFRDSDRGGAGSDTSQGTGGEVPPGVAEDQPYLEFPGADDAPVVDVYLDFLCPHCATFNEVNGEDLRELGEGEDATVRIHPRPMLDAQSAPVGYSGRAANVAVCTYAQDPALYWDVEDALFTNIPTDPADVPEDEELIDIAESAGASGEELESCVTGMSYEGWIYDVVEPEAAANTEGTPTVLIDGELFEGDTATPGALREAIEGA